MSVGRWTVRVTAQGDNTQCARLELDGRVIAIASVRSGMTAAEVRERAERMRELVRAAGGEPYPDRNWPKRRINVVELILELSKMPPDAHVLTAGYDTLGHVDGVELDTDDNTVIITRGEEL